MTRPGALRSWSFALALAFQCLVASGAASSVVYVSPLPGAENLRPETGLIARFDRDVAPSDVTIRVRGETSGDHPGRLLRSDDRRTFVFRPDRTFARGERVEVIVTSARAGESRNFAFRIAPGEVRAFDRTRVLDVESASRAVVAAADTASGAPPSITSTLTGATASGRLFMAPFAASPTPSYLMIVDDEGRPLYDRSLPFAAFDFKVQPDGRITWYDNSRAFFVAMDSTFTVVDSFACANGYLTDVHELRLLPNGHALLLGLDPQPVDMSKVVPGGDPRAVVAGMIIQELDAAKNVVFEWRSWDHFAITDATHENMTSDYIDYVHSNALEVDGDGNLLLSSRHMDEITKIDRQTGETIWRWGGKHNEFTMIDDPFFGFSHQHAIRVTADGHYTLFDNGNFNPIRVSRAVEYQLDEKARTARLVWQYIHPGDPFGAAMGYVERLPNGNTLISYGTGDPDVVEVGPDGSKRLEMKLPDNYFSYRVFRLPWGAQEGPAGPSIALSNGVPNPFSRSTRLTLTLPRDEDVSVDIYDVAGRRVRSILRSQRFPAGVHSLDVDLSPLRSGIYFCRMDAGGMSQTRRLAFVP